MKPAKRQRRQQTPDERQVLIQKLLAADDMGIVDLAKLRHWFCRSPNRKFRPLNNKAKIKCYH